MQLLPNNHHMPAPVHSAVHYGFTCSLSEDIQLQCIASIWKTILLASTFFYRGAPLQGIVQIIFGIILHFLGLTVGKTLTFGQIYLSSPEI